MHKISNINGGGRMLYIVISKYIQELSIKSYLNIFLVARHEIYKKKFSHYIPLRKMLKAHVSVHKLFYIYLEHMCLSLPAHRHRENVFE